jgi:hypothetical protein
MRGNRVAQQLGEVGVGQAGGHARFGRVGVAAGFGPDRGDAVGEPAECRAGHFRDTDFRPFL